MAAERIHDEPTCGKGLAENATLPAALGELVSAVSDVLDIHTRALDLSDPRSLDELEAYRELVASHRDIAARLKATAARMLLCRDLPMGAHDLAEMASPMAREAFDRFVRSEESLVRLVQQRMDWDRRLLADMGGA